MFDISTLPSSDTAIPFIDHNYQVLHFDCDPILFSGTNKYGARVLGSLVCEDPSIGKKRFLHAVVTSNEYSDFVRQRITYRAILERSKDIYIIERKLDHTLVATYLASTEDIPQSMLPTEESYCPEQAYRASSEFSISLKGRLADRHLAIPDTINTIQTSVASMLNSAIDPLRKIGVSPVLYEKPAEAASYQLKYQIVTPRDGGIHGLLLDESQYHEFIILLLRYCINNLPDEVDNVFSDDAQLDTTLLFSNVLPAYRELHASLGCMYSGESVDAIKNSTKEIVGSMNDIGGLDTSYDHIDLANNAESPALIGTINRETLSASIKAYEEIETLIEPVEEDEIPKKYEVYVYHINTETRKGNAILQHADGEEISKPKFTIEGDFDLEESKFTESVYHGTRIKVNAIAKRYLKTGKYKYLTIRE